MFYLNMPGCHTLLLKIPNKKENSLLIPSECSFCGKFLMTESVIDRSLLLKIPGAIASKLQDLCNKVLQGGRHVHSSIHSHL